MFRDIWEQIDTTRREDPAAKSVLEIVLLYPGFHAVVLHRISHWLFQQGVPFVPRFLSAVGRFLTGIEIHPGATIGRRFFIDHGMGVVIGETAEIGDDCTIYQGVTLGGTRPTADQAGHKRHPTIGNNVIISSNAQVLGPFKVGDGATIGAQAVVLKEVPPGATMVGNPARQITRRAPGEERPVFTPYGISGEDIPDPVARALAGLLDEIAGLRARLAEIEARGAAAGEEPAAESAAEKPALRALS